MIKYRIYKRISNIPQHIFNILVEDVTLWRTGGLMRERAENYRQHKFTFPVVVAFDSELGVPVGWVFLDCENKLEMCVRISYRFRGIATHMVFLLTSKINVPLRGYNNAAGCVIDRVINLKKSLELDAAERAQGAAQFGKMTENTTPTSYKFVT